MNYLLFVVFISAGPQVRVTSHRFSDEINCLKAIPKFIEIEKDVAMARVKAFCVKE